MVILAVLILNKQVIVFLVLFVVLLGGLFLINTPVTAAFIESVADVVGLVSGDLDDICSNDDSILYRYGGSWVCAKLNDVITFTNITVINNETVYQSSSLNVSNPANFQDDVTVEGNLTVGSNNLFVDNVSGNVGIGTTTPTQKLDVVGNININSSTSAYMYDGSVALKLAKGTDAVYTNTFVGVNAGNSSATRQTASGYQAGYQNTGAYQTASGYQAGYQNTGAYQTAIGMYAGYLNSGIRQVAIGYLAGYLNSGAGQTVSGYHAGFQNSGAGQTALSYYAGYQNSGAGQTALGYYAGYRNSGAYQTASGYAAGCQNTGAYQTASGYEAGYQNSGDNLVALGYKAGKDNTVNNQFIVQQANVNAVPLIQGDFSTGYVGIGTTTPTSKLHISGGVGSLATGLAFGDGDTGFHEISDDDFILQTGGNTRVAFASGRVIFGAASSYASIMNERATAINPVFTPSDNDQNTGIGRADADVLSLIAGGVNGLNVNTTGGVARVGIGTTTPQNTLNVVGDINVTGISYLKNITLSNGGSLYENATCTFLTSPDGSATLEVCNT